MQVHNNLNCQAYIYIKVKFFLEEIANNSFKINNACSKTESHTKKQTYVALFEYITVYITEK